MISVTRVTDFSYLYMLFAIIRILLTIMPQPGYIHPDEYFQSIDVVLGDIFAVQSARVWEFNKEFPIRNIFIPYVVYGIPLVVLKYLIKLGYNIGTTPYLFVTLPRLMCCCSSFFVDFSLYKICKMTNTDPKKHMVVLSTSYVMLLYGTRTFSNTIEMILFSVLLYVVAGTMKNAQKINFLYNELENVKKASVTDNERIRQALAQKRLPDATFEKCPLIATILVIGIYNRLTFAFYALMPIFFWLRRSVKRPVDLTVFHYRIWSLMLASLPSVIFLTLTDSVYYGCVTLEQLLNVKTAIFNTNYVLTPYNFFVYNTNVTNLATHGLHPLYLHLLINVPLLFNVLGICHVIFTCLHVYRFFISRRMLLPELQTINTMMFCSSVIPLMFLSFFSHQEPRFLVPLIVPMVFLYTDTLYNSQSSNGGKSKLWAWFLCNLFAFIFYSYLHQGATYHLTNRLSEIYGTSPKTEPLCVITSHTYSIPASMIQAPYFKTTRYDGHGSNSKRVFIHNLGSSSRVPDVIPTAVKTMRNVCRPTKPERITTPIYLIAPTILTGMLYDNAVRHGLSFTTEQIYYVHFSTELFVTVINNYLTGGARLTTRYDTYSDISEQSLLDYVGLSIIRFD